MSTSEARQRGHAAARGRGAFATLGVGLAFALALVPGLVGGPLLPVGAPHLGWLGVLVLAARYGLGGVLWGLLAFAAAWVIGVTVAGMELLDAWSRLRTTPNLVAFGACLAVSWVASWHLRRVITLREALAGLGDRARRADQTVGTLCNVVADLRARVDRSSSSLSFLREAAERLEGSDPVAAAEGAADLALARTGASAVVIGVGLDGSRPPLAVRDARGPGMLAPLVIREAPLRVPIRDESGRIGIMALWGIPPERLDPATRHDLEVVASWCADALAGVPRRLERVPELEAGRP